ncbi:DUF4296 domain-containing protein [Sediminibacterium sp.]|uniref:DUF4296 domain-containing protein n=1 Tax=Sediminibacterium sp. TaxID=1917865 RepID=UPI002715E17C|nr:DUF4296 domain-containing protein [Sediminibacterium sp.]MDO9000369.1 DUF4296 domain-containing protein [Bacteroidota bacterium]MDP3147062.1 DUF4296 domain-containing protein [Bacteroidota bacterium]MDP3567402.1 DUF4296 domain-containing protein [Sediminibacterium sp.]
MKYSFLNKLLLIFLAFSFSCSLMHDDDVIVPDSVLNEEIFTKVIVDFALAESVGNINVKNVSSEKLDSVYAFSPLEENNITVAQYDSALSFYSKHPALYKKIYDNVLITLSKMQTKRDTIKTDSIAK